MQIICPDCRAVIAGEDVNIQTGLAKCGGCGSVFGIAGQVGGTFSAPKRVIELPARFKTAHEGGDFVITYRWFSAKHVFLLFFCVFWDGFLVFWYNMALRGDIPLHAMLFPVFHVLFGFVLTYVVIAGFLNSTRIRINREQVTATYYPVPFPGSKRISTYDISQFYTHETVSRTKNGRSVVYEVWIEKKDMMRCALVKYLEKGEQALFIEQEAEKFLNISDKPVPGEYR
ncbi:MAG: hypothetical protein PHW69_08900 [Elusimicrobiaceae bacterium]|nr:hypothetical protein [Elusimicrobiaceae bacterium]